MTISKTFCPAKWDEILVNLSANYVYSCCKAVPIKIAKKEDINNVLDNQKYNLLNGIQDPACNYCWQVENQGHQSLRHSYLEKFDNNLIEQYKNNTVPIKQIEVSLGNECNFQCTYCNPKFSSQWESDVKNKNYKIYSDRYFYAVEDKNSDTVNNSIKWLKQQGSIDTLNMIGGEPTQNKNFFKVINNITSTELGFSTNLSCKKSMIDKILKLSSRYKHISIGVSIDSTGTNAEFSRYGLNFVKLLDNIEYLLDNAPPNITVSFNSLMTSITIRDFDNIVNLIDLFYAKNSNIIWNINFCRDPSILTLNTLPEQFKSNILEKINSIKDKKYIQGLNMLEGVLVTSKFNKTLYGQLKEFLKEFSSRKNISIPIELD
jgi:organic radical activating enzyme